MRIIAGEFKGRKLTGPEGAGVRPTADRLRETLFNILSPAIDGVVVLDAYAGTGALGLEALSRGAARAIFIEAHRRVINVLNENIQKLGVAERTVVLHRDFLKAAAGVEKCGLILLDPPYDVEDLDAVVGTAASLLAPGGRIVLEHSRRRPSPESAGAIPRTRVVEAGDSALSFYQ